MKPIWLEVIAVDGTMEKLTFIVEWFCLSQTKEGEWAIGVGGGIVDEEYVFGTDEEAARKLYGALEFLKPQGGGIRFFEESLTTKVTYCDA